MRTSADTCGPCRSAVPDPGLRASRTVAQQNSDPRARWCRTDLLIASSATGSATRLRRHAQSTPSSARAARWAGVSLLRRVFVLVIHTPSFKTTWAVSPSTVISSAWPRGTL